MAGSSAAAQGGQSPEQEPEQGGESLPELEQPMVQLPDLQHSVSAAGIEPNYSGSVVSWRSPRLRQAMLQTGVAEHELMGQPEELYLKEALARGVRLGWKSKRAVRQIAAKRYKTAELQRRKLLDTVVDIRAGLIRNNTELSIIISPKKKVSISDDPDMERKLREEAERRRRAMASEEQRAEAANMRLDEQMQLKLEKEAEMMQVEQKFAQKRHEREVEAQKRREAAVVWALELEKQREQEADAAAKRADAFEVARIQKEGAMAQMLEKRQQVAREKSLQFTRKQDAKALRIHKQWEEKQEKLWETKLESEKKMVASEKAREQKRTKEAADRKKKAAEKEDAARRRLLKKREQDLQEYEKMVSSANDKFKAVDTQLEKKRAEKDRQIAEGQKLREKKEAEMRSFMKKRAEQEAARVRLIEAERAAKNTTLEKVLQGNEERSVLLSETQAIKFEQTVANIARMQRTREFRSEALAMEQQEKNERAQLLLQKKEQMAAERRYAAQQFLLEQERMHEALETSARDKATEMAQLSMGRPNKLVAKSKLMKTLERISTPLPRGHGLMVPLKNATPMKGRDGLAGRDSPLPVWVWSVHNMGTDGIPQPRFVT